VILSIPELGAERVLLVNYPRRIDREDDVVSAEAPPGTSQ
jgi:hypothetical protein